MKVWPFGLMTSQTLAIFYLDCLDKYIKEELKIKGYIRYQDDFLIFHQDKNYLKNSLAKLVIFLKENCCMELNSKTRIYKSTNNYIFLGRTKYNHYHRYREVKRRIKANKIKFLNDEISVSSFLISSLNLTGVNYGKSTNPLILYNSPRFT